jgi:DNA/RNA-binding domain of Phe-tRNA-synthetase-like protein
MMSGFERLRSIFPSFPSLPHLSLSLTHTHKMAHRKHPEGQPVNEHLFLADVTLQEVHFSSDLEAEVEGMPVVEAELAEAIAELEDLRDPDHDWNRLYSNMKTTLRTQREIDEMRETAKLEARKEHEAQHSELQSLH